ncbi:hypothetical protein ACTXT7_012965 [Hymenolepis weldensis]
MTLYETTLPTTGYSSDSQTSRHYLDLRVATIEETEISTLVPHTFPRGLHFQHLPPIILPDHSVNS